MHRSDRGSTFLIVLSVLTLLVLLAATFTYTSRLEIRMAGNYAESVQARFAAMGGLQAAAVMINERPGLAVAANQRWALASLQPTVITPPAAAPKAASGPANRANNGVRLDWTHELQAMVKVQDEGGKIALNALANEERERNDETFGALQFDTEDLRLTIERLAKHYAITGLDPSVLSHSIVAYLQKNARSNTATTKDTAAINTLSPGIADPVLPEEDEKAIGVNAYGILSTDPRFESTEPSSGPEQPFLLMEDLAALPGMPKDPAMAQKAIMALSTSLTPFTQCRLAYEDNGEAVDCLDPNEDDALTIYNALLELYPEVEEGRLKQYVVNLIDWRDRDSIPSSFPSNESVLPILGWERNVCINEVWPDSVTSDQDGDDGEYFEIYNPYDSTISVDGWYVKINTGGASIRLKGQIPPRGVLVVTDDRDNQGDGTEDDKPGYGSFYDIFGRLGNGASQRLLEQPALDLPNSSATLYLYNNDNQLIDYLQYDGMANGGVRVSAQRTDPRLHATRTRPCTPLEPNSGDNTDSVDFSSKLKRDQAIQSPAELFRIPAYLPDALDQEDKDGYRPRLKDSSVGLDARLLDVFAIGGEDQPILVQINNGHLAAPTDRANLPAKRVGLLQSNNPQAAFQRANNRNPIQPASLQQEDVQTSATVRVAAGRININTAPRPVLLALPGMTEQLADRILAWREGKSRAASQPASGQRRAPAQAVFASISDFLNNDTVWEGQSAQERLTVYRYFANLITVNSQVFMVDSQNRVPVKPSDDRRPSVSQNRLYMLVDAQGRPSVLSWRFLR